MAMSYQNRLGDFARAFAAQQALVPRFVSASVARDQMEIDRESEAVLREMEARRREAQREARRIAAIGELAGSFGEGAGRTAGTLLGTYEDELGGAFGQSEYQMLRKDLGLPRQGLAVRPYYDAFGRDPFNL
jgi:hypothetical protein